MDLFWYDGSIRAKLIVLGQRWLYSGNRYCFLAKVVVFWQKWLYSGKVVIFFQK